MWPCAQAERLRTLEVPGKLPKQFARVINEQRRHCALEHLIIGAEWSSEVVVGAFHIGRSPSGWRGFMAFAEPVPGWCVGKSDDQRHFVASEDVPMGCISAVAVF